MGRCLRDAGLFTFFLGETLRLRSTYQSSIMPTLPLVFRLVLGAIVLVAAVYDWRYRRIPNWLNLSGLILGLGLNLLYFQIHGAAQASEGLLLAMAVYFPLYLLRGMGAGDVKLMAAIGSIVGPGHWFEIFLATALAGGSIGLLAALRKGRLRRTFWNVWYLLRELRGLRLPYKSNPELDIRNKQALRLPHGVLIAVGCLVVLVGFPS